MSEYDKVRNERVVKSINNQFKGGERIEFEYQGTVSGVHAKDELIKEIERRFGKIESRAGGSKVVIMKGENEFFGSKSESEIKGEIKNSLKEISEMSKKQHQVKIEIELGIEGDYRSLASGGIDLEVLLARLESLENFVESMNNARIESPNLTIAYRNGVKLSLDLTNYY